MKRTMLLTFLLITLGANARIYYVSLTGNNNNSSGPWRNIAFALKSSLLRPGDTVSIGAGTFVETETCRIPCGVSLIGNGQTGSSATIIKGSISPLVLLENCQSGSNRQRIAKFKLDGQAKSAGRVGMEVRRVYGVLIHELNVEDFKGTFNGGGINLSYAVNSSVSNCFLKNNADTSRQECGGNLGLAELDYCYFYDLVIDATTGYAVKNALVEQNVIRNSSFFNNRFEVRTNRCAAWNTLSVELHIQHCENVKIYNCYFNNTLSISESVTKKGFEIFNNHFQMPPSLGDAYPLEATTSSLNVHHNFFEGGLYAVGNWQNRATNKNTIFHHNVFDKNWAYVDIMHVPAGLVESGFYNNTMVTPGRLIEFFDLNVESGKPPSNVDIRNNIFIATSTDPADIGPTGNSVFNTNVFYNTVSTRGSNIKTSNPNLPFTGSFPSRYVPGAGSSAIDFGVPIPGITDGANGTPDIGAFETGQTPWTVGVNSNPIASARIFSDKTSGTIPLTVNFDGATSRGTGISYNWDFGNGQTSTANKPSASYTTAGIYRVRLIVTASGKKDTTYLNISATNGAPGSITDGGIYELQPQNATQLRLNASSSANKTFLNVATANGGTGQKWKLVGKGPGIYELVPQNSTSRRMDIPYSNDSAGALVQIYDSRNHAGQRWILLPLGGDIYALEPQCGPNKRLDVKGGLTASGTPVQTWNPNTSNAQKWKLIPAAALRQAAPETFVIEAPKDEVLLYPNPGRGNEFFVEGAGGGNMFIRLFNQEGKEFPVRTQVQKGGRVSVKPTSNLLKGVYLVKVKTDKLDQTKKLIVTE